MRAKRGEKRQAKAEPKVTLQNGMAVLTLEAAAQKNAGIAATPLEAALYIRELRAYGTVLQPGPLIDIRDGCIKARASIDKATAALEKSGREYERLKKLNEDEQNISDKVLQAASAEMHSDQADLSASREGLQAVRRAAVARWGRFTLPMGLLFVSGIQQACGIERCPDKSHAPV